MFKLLVEMIILERINSLPHKEANNLKDKLKLLKNNHFPDGRDKKAIKGSRKTAYRLRSGSYGFFYIIDLENKVVKVTEFLAAEQAHRKYGRL